MSEQPDDQQEQLRRVSKVVGLVEIEDIRLAMLYFFHPEDEDTLDEFATEYFTEVRECESGRLLIETGYRLARHVGVDGANAEQPSEEDAEHEVLAAAHFLVSYTYKEEPEPVNLPAFAHYNAVLNTWPYWRQQVQQGSSAMGLPQIIVPVYKIPMLKLAAGQAEN